MEDSDAENITWNQELSQAQLDEMLAKARRPGLAMMKTLTPDAEGAQGCWLGGEPTLPPEIEWPFRYSEIQQESIPLHFLAQINLASVPRLEGLPELPENGTLFFFYDAVLGDPEKEETRVIFVPGDVQGYPYRPMPPIPQLPKLDSQTLWFARRPTHGYKRWNINFTPFEGFRVNISVNKHFRQYACEAGIEASAAFEKQTRRQRPKGADDNPNFEPHHMFGSTGRNEPEGDFIRLIAFKSDPDLHLDYGGDWIVFWISKEDFKENNFEAAFLHGEFQ